MILRLVIVLVGCTVLFGGVFGMKYMGSKGMNAYFDSMPIPAATISAAEVSQASWPKIIEAVGTLTAVNGIEVTTEAAGIVKSIRFESGDHVKKGDVLVTLDADTDRADLKNLEAQAALAGTELERLHKLYELESISKAELDRAQSQSTQAKAKVQAQRARIEQKIIRAPFTGELGIRKVDLGEYISPGTPMVSLQALNPLYVDFTLPEQKINRVQPGQTVNVRVDLYPGEVFTGKVQAIDSVVNSETRNFKVRATVDNEARLLRAGVFAKVVIELDGADEVLMVPRTAISYNAYGNSVFVLVEKPAAEGSNAEPTLIARQRFVKTGEGQGDFVAITEGLKAGELIATSGLLKLRNDQPVVINNDFQPGVSLKPTPEDT